MILHNSLALDNTVVSSEPLSMNSDEFYSLPNNLISGQGSP